MSSERYYRLQEIVGEQSTADFPVMLEKAALLLDTVSKSAILQCKLVMLGVPHTELSEVTLKYFGYDENGKEIDRGDFTYKDINLFGGIVFGTMTPIVLNKGVRKADVFIVEGILTDGTLLTATPLVKFQQKQFAELSPELFDQYNRTISEFKHTFLSPLTYVPVQRSEDWLCSCGLANLNDHSNCRSCGHQKKSLFIHFSEEALLSNSNLFLEQTEAKRVEKERQEVEQRNRQERFIKRFLVPILGFGVFVFGILTIAYLIAGINFNNKNYDTASSIYSKLLGIYDSEEMANYSVYQKGVTFLEAKKFDQAKIIFNNLQNFRNSEILVFDADFRHANDELAKGNYNAAKAIFLSISSYSDSADRAKEIDLLVAKNLMEAGDYTEAKKLIGSVGSFPGTLDMLLECDYQLAFILLNDGKYDESKAEFTKLGKYKDSATLVIESDYQKAKSLLDAGSLTDGITLLEANSTYKESPELINATRYVLATTAIKNKDFATAAEQLFKLKGYKDSDELVNKEIYPYAMELYSMGKWELAIKYLGMIDLSKRPEVKNFLIYAKANLEQQKKKEVYDQAMALIQKADYKKAYELLTNLKYSNSDYLALYYGTLAYPWKVTGGMTKTSFRLSERFSATWQLSGGPPGGKANITTVCRLPNGGKVDEVVWSVSSGDGWTYSCYYTNWIYGSTGQGEIKIKNYDTGETLATFPYWVGY
jgi:tetratricopeptide (TPR) repeat protein